MVMSSTGKLLFDKEDTWFMEALYTQIVKETIRLVAMEKAVCSGGDYSESLNFVLNVIKSIAENEIKKITMDTIKEKGRYYVKITGSKSFDRQPLIPFKGFYKWLIAKRIHKGQDPSLITDGDLYAVINEKLCVREQSS